MPKAIGILGGTFDPIHYGHLRLAQEVSEALGLAQTRFIPGGTPPHRAAPQSAVAQRVAMVKLAIADNPLFAIDERETNRRGPSYSFDTLAELRAELGPAQPLVLMLGADAFVAFNRWHRWREIFSLAHIAVAHRPGATLTDIQEETLARELAQRRTSDATMVHRTCAGAIVVAPITALDISATAIRAAIHARRSVRYLLPAAVLAHIESNHLFLKDNL